jgi:hypothetical protein
LAKAAGLSDAEKEQFRVANDVLNRYKDEKPAEPAAYDRPVQLWLYIVGCGVLGVPWFVWAQWQISRRRYRLDDDGTFHAPEGTFSREQIVGIDLTTWMSKAIAWVEVEGSRRIQLDDYKYRFTEDIVGVLAQRFYPGEWTSDARPIGDPKSRDTKKALAEQGDAGDGGVATTAAASAGSTASANSAGGKSSRGAEAADDEVGNGLTLQLEGEHLATAFLLRLLDAGRDLVRLRIADASAATAVANDDHRREAEATATRDGGRGAVDADGRRLDG